MTESPDPEELEARLEIVHTELLELRARVAYIEDYLRGSSSPATAELVAVVEQPALPPAPVTAWVEPPRVEPSWEPPTVAGVDPSPAIGMRIDNPIKVLSLTGGVALLLGLGFFVVYAIEQAWVPPSVRFVVAAIASALLTMAAWPIARRGYDAVAGAIGGAGLGGWFAAWLVAHHVHALVSVPATFGALVVGAAACLLIADRLKLRLMAGLASAAACATPALVMSGDSGIHGLMAYQLLVIAGLVALDARRGWPELPTIGLLATWVLASSWGVGHLHGSSDDALLAWAVVLLAASAGSGWRLVVGKFEWVDATHVVVRLLIGGLATWAFAAATLGTSTISFAVATALLSVWHLGLAVAMRSRATQVRGMFLVIAWVQAFLFGPIRLREAELASWWIALAVVLTVVPWNGLQRVRRPLSTISVLAAVVVCLDADARWSLPLGILASAVLLAASLWPYPRDANPRPIAWLAILTTLVWGSVVGLCGPDSPVAQLALGLVPGAVLLGWACWRPSSDAQLVGCAQLALGSIGAISLMTDAHALSLFGDGDAGERLGMAVILLVFAVLGATNVGFGIASARGSKNVTGLGLLTAPVLGLAGLLVVAGIADGTPALGQVGYSLTIAGVGLGLIVAGLRLQDGHWRQVGLAAIAVAAVKVVLFDLDSAAVGWRALSFIGLGVILIGGAFAYSRAARRAAILHAGVPAGESP